MSNMHTSDIHPAFHPQGKWMKPKPILSSKGYLWWVAPHPTRPDCYAAFPDIEYDDTRWRIHKAWMDDLFYPARPQLVWTNPTKGTT